MIRSFFVSSNENNGLNKLSPRQNQPPTIGSNSPQKTLSSLMTEELVDLSILPDAPTTLFHHPSMALAQSSSVRIAEMSGMKEILGISSVQTNSISDLETLQILYRKAKSFQPQINLTCRPFQSRKNPLLTIATSMHFTQYYYSLLEPQKSVTLQSSHLPSHPSSSSSLVASSVHSLPVNASSVTSSGSTSVHSLASTVTPAALCPLPQGFNISPLSANSFHQSSSPSLLMTNPSYPSIHHHHQSAASPLGHPSSSSSSSASSSSPVISSYGHSTGMVVALNNVGVLSSIPPTPKKVVPSPQYTTTSVAKPPIPLLQNQHQHSSVSNPILGSSTVPPHSTVSPLTASKTTTGREKVVSPPQSPSPSSPMMNANASTTGPATRRRNSTAIKSSSSLGSFPNPPSLQR